MSYVYQHYPLILRLEDGRQVRVEDHIQHSRLIGKTVNQYGEIVPDPKCHLCGESKPGHKISLSDPNAEASEQEGWICFQCETEMVQRMKGGLKEIPKPAADKPADEPQAEAGAGAPDEDIVERIKKHVKGQAQ